MLNTLKNLFVRFYCMDIPDILWLLFWGTVGFLALYRRFRGNRWVRLSAVAVLLCWIAVAIYATIGDRAGGNGAQINLIPFHSYREVRNGGNPELYRSNFMNAVLFYPAGLLVVSLLPERWSGWCRCVAVVALVAALSAGIEYVQYSHALGRCEIDDVIHNTAGALAGAIAALWLLPLLSRLWAEGKRLWARYAQYRANAEKEDAQ